MKKYANDKCNQVKQNTGSALKLAIIVLAVFLVYFFLRQQCLFISTRNTDFLTYEFMSGKIFNIDYHDVSSISLRDGSNGNEIVFSARTDVKNIADKLNAIRYKTWTPVIPVRTGGWSYAVCISDQFGGDCTFFLTASGKTILNANGVNYSVRDRSQIADLIYMIDAE